MKQWVGRVAVVLAGVVGVVAIAGAAFAHVEVSANPDTAGATNAVLTFKAEAESTTAGIASVEIVLPAPIVASDVALTTAPTGWTLTTTTNGYKVGGPTLPKGKDAVHSVTVTHLPNVTTITFKALVTYGDGQVDRWIEEPSAANPTPENPAAILTLKPAPSAVTLSAVTGSVTASSEPDLASTAVSARSGDSTAWLWWVAGLVVVAALIIALLAWRRRAEEKDRH
jgi:uncharacterized protein YcnI